MVPHKPRAVVRASQTDPHIEKRHKAEGLLGYLEADRSKKVEATEWHRGCGPNPKQRLDEAEDNARRTGHGVLLLERAPVTLVGEASSDVLRLP